MSYNTLNIVRFALEGVVFLGLLVGIVTRRVFVALYGGLMVFAAEVARHNHDVPSRWVHVAFAGFFLVAWILLDGPHAFRVWVANHVPGVTVFEDEDA